MPRHSHRLIVVASAGLLTLATLVALDREDGGADDGTDVVGSLSGAPTSFYGGSSRASGPCTFASGARMAYDVQTSTNTVIDMSPLLGGVRLEGSNATPKATTLDQRAAKTWRVDLEAVAGAADGSTVLAAHIEGGALERAGASTPAKESLADTFLVRVGPQCDVLELGWRTDGDHEAANQQQQLLVGLGWLAPRAREASWTGALLDPVGRYHASFFREDDRVHGRAVEFDEAFGQHQGGSRPRFDVVESTIEVEPRDGAWFESLTSVRSLEMSVYGIPVGNLDHSVVAVRGEPGSWRPEVSLDDGGWSWGLLLGQSFASDGAGAGAETSSPLAGVAVAEAVEQYLAMIHGGRSPAESVGLLTEWLQANPEGAAKLVSLLREGTFDDERSGRSGLFLALGKAQTPEAANALLSIVEGAGDSIQHKLSAALALSKVESQTEAMVDAVVAVAEQGGIHPEERGTLQMTLGAFARRNAERAPELAAKAREHIGGWLAEPSDDEALASSLLAAGNTGHDELVPAIEPYLEHDDPQIRQRAATAMRHMSPTEAYPRLESRVSDESLGVRVSAIETITNVSRKHGIAPPDSVVDHAIGQLELGSAAHEQKALIELLGQASEHGNTEAAAVLDQRLAEGLRSGERDPNELRALGKHINTRWVAPD